MIFFLSAFCLGIASVYSSTGDSLLKQNADKEIYRYEKGHRFFDILGDEGIPFFLYTGGDFDVFTANCEMTVWSKGVEVPLLLHLQGHPWRTKDPEKALLFIIPALYSLAQLEGPVASSDSLIGANQTDIAAEAPTRVGYRCRLGLKEMSTRLVKAVFASSFYQRHWGADHVIAISYFKAEKLVGPEVSVLSTVFSHFSLRPLARTRLTRPVPSSQSELRILYPRAKSILDYCLGRSDFNPENYIVILCI
jgi:hypothetical protein